MRSGKKDNLTKSKRRIKKYGEVYTPEWLVKKMCDMLIEENKDGEDVFRPSSTFLEPSCGNGNFLVEILDRKLAKCKTDEEYLIALDSIYGIDILQDNVEESKQRMLDIFQTTCGLFDIEKAKDILDKRIVCGDSLKIMAELQKNKSWEQSIEDAKKEIC